MSIFQIDPTFKYYKFIEIFYNPTYNNNIDRNIIDITSKDIFTV